MTFAPPIAPLHRDGDSIVILDQTRLPYIVETRRLSSLEEVVAAIGGMQVRGAPLIGAAAAFGIALALRDDASDLRVTQALDTLAATRPTAVNLHWALARLRSRLLPLPPPERREAAWREAEAIGAEDRQSCAAIASHGFSILRQMAERRDGPVRIMTHCNAGWLATMGAGTALAPIYHAHQQGVKLQVWVSETRPRNQGLLTEWELRQSGIPHQLIADNAAGILLSRGEVDIVITGADRVAANGDTANKVGTYLKALAAADNAIPFYIAAPRSTFDFHCPTGQAIPIEDRGATEVNTVQGLSPQGEYMALRLAPDTVAAANPAFDITPARLITGIVTERGIFAPGQLHLLSGN